MTHTARLHRRIEPAPAPGFLGRGRGAPGRGADGRHGGPAGQLSGLLDRAIAALPAGVERVRCRWDAGYFVAELVTACLGRGVEFAIGAKRTAPVMSAAAGVPEPAWVPAVGMENSELAVVDRYGLRNVFGWSGRLHRHQERG